jgi:hypothetical protein
MNEEKEVSWTLELGLYPGILLGIRTYEYEESKVHVLYLPFIDIALEIF